MVFSADATADQFPERAYGPIGVVHRSLPRRPCVGMCTNVDGSDQAFLSMARIGLVHCERTGDSGAMHEIPRARFDILAGDARRPGAELFGREFAWFESTSGNVLALLILDPDLEYLGILFARDLAQRYRWVGQTDFYLTREEAVSELEARVIAADESPELWTQGDEGIAMDFFEEVKERRLHDRYKVLASNPAWAPARNVVENVMSWYEDGDGNFVEQFQTDGFDARIWEVYLFAMLVENGYAVSHPDPAPDFLAERLGRRFTVEATTVNSSVIGGKPAPSVKPKTDREVDAYMQQYLPIRFAGPLTAKLAKEYWTQPEASGLPLLFAIQDFHDEFSMTYSGHAVQTYLYGQRIVAIDEADGTTTRYLEKVDWHGWGTKHVASGFFYLPAAENVSAVLFNAAGTLAKFNRIGVATGFDSAGVRLIHHGTRFMGENPAGPTPFLVEVTNGSDESWSDGLWVFHNPNAKLPIDPDWLPAAAHVQWDGAQLNSTIPEGHLDSSVTAVVGIRGEGKSEGPITD